MGWPIATDDFEDRGRPFYDFTAEELGIDAANAAKIDEIKRLRPLSPNQPWGSSSSSLSRSNSPSSRCAAFCSHRGLKKRASANSAEQPTGPQDDLLFISNYGEGDERQDQLRPLLAGTGRPRPADPQGLGWDNLDTALHLDAVARELTEHLAWPDRRRGRRGLAHTLARRLHPWPPRGRHDLEGPARSASPSWPARIRDRIKTALAIETDRGPSSPI